MMRMKKGKKLLSLVLCFSIVGGGLTGDLVLHPEKTAKAASNTSIETAAVLQLNTLETVTFGGESDEEYWYSFTVPEDIGNHWIEIATTNFTSGKNLGIRLYDSFGTKICTYSGVSVQSTGTIRIWPEGSGYNGSVDGIYTAGETYYIETYASNTYWPLTGDVWLQARTIPDDNWGTLETAETLKNNKTVKRELEYSDDIDTFKIELSKGKEYTLILNSSDKKNIYIYNSTGILIDTYSVSSGSKTIYFTGDIDDDTNYISILGGNSGEYSLVFFRDPAVAKVTGLTSKSKTKEKKKVKWNKVKNAKGYEIYGSYSKNGSYSKLCTVKGNTCTITVLLAHYYVKVRAYTKKNGITYYGSYSKVKKIK